MTFSLTAGTTLTLALGGSVSKSGLAVGTGLEAIMRKTDKQPTVKIPPGINNFLNMLTVISFDSIILVFWHLKL